VLKIVIPKNFLINIKMFSKTSIGEVYILKYTTQPSLNERVDIWIVWQLTAKNI
jgi:hypothetical protein